MKDPPRLLDDGADDFEQSLLTSASRDLGSERLLKQTLSAVSLTPVAVATTMAASKTAAASAATTATSKTALVSVAASASAAAAKAETLLLLKWVLGGALAGLTTVGVYSQVEPSRETPVAVTAPGAEGAQPPARLPSSDRAGDVAAPRRADAESDLQAPSLPPNPEPRAAAPPAAAPEARAAGEASAKLHAGLQPIEAAGATASSAAPSRTSALTAEVASLDRVRRALRAGDAARALHELDAHRAEFPRGVLGPEATVLRIEVLVLAGQRGAAQALAGELLASPANAAHATRVESLLRRPSNP